MGGGGTPFFMYKIDIHFFDIRIIILAAFVMPAAYFWKRDGRPRCKIYAFVIAYQLYQSCIDGAKN